MCWRVLARLAELVNFFKIVCQKCNLQNRKGKRRGTPTKPRMSLMQRAQVPGASRLAVLARLAGLALLAALAPEVS